MLRRKVRSPDGREWRIGRRWLPRRPRLMRAPVGDIGDLGPLELAGFDPTGIVAAIAFAVLAVVCVLLLLNVIAIALELLIVIVLLTGGLIGRVVFRRPWIVFARSDSVTYAWPVTGWLRSRRVIADVAAQLSVGTRDPQPAEVEGSAPPSLT
jgi:hypothetical protein